MLGRKIIGLERSLPVRLAKIVFGSGFLAVRRAESELVENQGSAVVQSELGWLPLGALVEAIGIGIGWIPRTVEPVEVRFVIGDPFLDRQPGRLDRLHGLDVEGRRWRAWELDKTLPQPVEAEEKFGLLAVDDLADRFHGALAAGAFERIAAPDLENQVTPEGAHVAGGLFGRRGN